MQDWTTHKGHYQMQRYYQARNGFEYHEEYLGGQFWIFK